MVSGGKPTHSYMYDSSYRLFGKSFLPNIVMFVCLVSFIPMLVVSGMVLDRFSISHNEKLFAHLEELVQKHTLEIDGFLNERLRNIQFLADSAGFETLLNEAVLKQQLIRLQQTHDGVFEDLGIVNEQGIQEFYAGRLELEQARYASANWFDAAFANEVYISDVFLGLRSSPHFFVSVKRTHQGNNYLLRATINFDAFNFLAENLRIGKTGFAFILNRQNEFQTKPHYDMLPRKLYFQQFIKAGKKSKDGAYIGNLKDGAGDGPIIYVASLLKNEDWILVFQQNRSEAFAELKRAQFTAMVIIFMGALLIVVMNLILFHKIINRFAETDREKEIMNRQVIESGKLASVGELAAGIAHEINNPVAIMVQEAGWIEDLLEEEEFKKGKNLDEFNRALKQVQKQGIRCKEITHKLLSFARQTSPTVEEIEINAIIEEVVSITDMAAYTKVSMNTYLEENLPPIYGSQTEIQQVLLNLINNALYALEKEGGKLDITSKLEGDQVLVIVEDDGPGIPEANLERIFDPFFTTKPVGKGSGLGLSICFGIIKKMGGDISVHSVVDIGTRFEVRFPLKQTMEPRVKVLTHGTVAVSEAAAPEKETALSKRIRLLLVDDEKSFVKVLSKRMDRRNIDVSVAYSGTEAIQALRKVDFDVAVLDLKMEDMDGLEVLKIFKKMYADMEVIILSGHQSEEAAREGIKYGAYAYLAKPCKFEDLINTIKKSVSA